MPLQHLQHQTTHFVHLIVLLCSEQYRHSEMLLPVILGVDDKRDLHLIDLATEKHWSIQNDTPADRHKVLQLVLLSLLYKQTPETLQLVWIDTQNTPNEWIPKVITPYAFSTATEPKELLQALVTENQKRVENHSASPRIVALISDAYALYQQYPDLCNTLEESYKQGIHLIGSALEYTQQQATIKQVVNYHNVFETLLCYKGDSEMLYEQTDMLLPFFEEEAFERIVRFREKSPAIPTKIPFEEGLSLKEHVQKLWNERKEKLYEVFSGRKLREILASSLSNSYLHSSDGKTVIPLSSMKCYYNHCNQSAIFKETFLRLIDKRAHYHTAEATYKIGNVLQVQVLKANGQVLVNQEAAYTSTRSGKLVPFVVKEGTCAFSWIGLHPEQPISSVLDTLPNSAYPQLSKVVTALRERTQASTELIEVKYAATKLFLDEVFTEQLTPVALISELEEVLSKVSFELVNSKYNKHRK